MSFRPILNDHRSRWTTHPSASFSFIPHLVDDHQYQNHEIKFEKSSCELDETTVSNIMLSNIVFCMVLLLLCSAGCLSSKTALDDHWRFGCGVRIAFSFSALGMRVRCVRSGAQSRRASISLESSWGSFCVSLPYPPEWGRWIDLRRYQLSIA